MNSFVRLIGILVILPVIGTIGFMTIEKWRFIDALYMSLITLSTVGYEVVHPLTDAGKLFVIFFLTAGLAVFFYSLTQLGEMAVGGELQRLLGGGMMKRRIAGMENHYIICGLGRMGRSVAKSLHDRGHPFVAIEKDAQRVEHARAAGWACIEGDATVDDILLEAGLDRARCFATVLPNDSDNLFAVMSARLLQKNLTIITRAGDDGSIDKLKRAGATRIVSPYSAGATKMAQFMLNPQLEDFVEILNDKELELDLTMIHVGKHSTLKGKTLKDLRLTDKGVMIVGLRRASNKVHLPPPLDVALNENDSLIAVGRSTDIQAAFGITE